MNCAEQWKTGVEKQVCFRNACGHKPGEWAKQVFRTDVGGVASVGKGVYMQEEASSDVVA